MFCLGDIESTEIDRISVLPCCVQFWIRHSDKYITCRVNPTGDLVWR